MRRTLLAAALLLAAAPHAFAFKKKAPPPPPVAANPLDQLTPRELEDAVAIVRAAKIFPPEALFPVITLQEPPKAEVLAWKPGQPFRREAFAVVLDRARNETSEALVDLKKKELLSWRIIPGVQPNFLVEELATSVPDIVRADPRWQEAMKKRGITDLKQVLIDAWAPGTVGLATSAEGPRLARALSFYKGTSTNFYGRPVEGVVALVDLNKRVVEQLVDTGVVALSPDDGAYDEAAQPSLRPQPKPLTVVQAEGPDFTLAGSEVRWQNWRFHFGLTPREGLVLQRVTYDDHGKERSVLYRAALSEMVVPYGDPDSNWAWRSAFDEGEYGVGRLIAPLEAGTDVPDNAVFVDGAFADDFGKPYSVPKAAALYERDGGLLWKHYDFDSLRNESRRARELVLTSVAAVGNYDYAFSWIFRQDGSLECEVGLTGIMLAKGVEVSSAAVAADHHAGHYMHLVSTGIAAPHHQHFFNYRLDFDVDGATNTVYEMDTRMLPPGKDNPFGNSMAVEETPLRSEKAARRDMNLAATRRWIVRNPGVVNALGQPVGYALVPGDNTVPYIRPESPVRKRASFVEHHLWATVYDPEQRYAAGDYPNQSRGWEGLERWTTDDDPLENQDVVLWYTFGVTHVPRPEEWPIMPMTKAGFKLLPASFFSRNPALDVPRPQPPTRKK